MAFHIVTNRCFLACEKVTSVVLEPVLAEKPDRLKTLFKTTKKKGKKAKKTAVKKVAPEQTFCISISYYPLAVTQQQRNSGDPQENTMEVRVVGEAKANKLYQEIIREVEEQHPNEGYLNKLVDKLFNGESLLATES